MGDCNGLDAYCLPPFDLGAGSMHFVMMEGAEGYGAFVADVLSEGAGLDEAQVMRLRRLAAADGAGLGGDETKMLSVANGRYVRNMHRPRGPAFQTELA